MFRRAFVIALVLALLVPSAALAQGGAFGPLPQAAPEPTATPTADKSDDSLTSDLGGRTTLWVIAGGLLIAFVAIGVFISRDARRALPKGHRPDSHRLREQGARRRSARRDAGIADGPTGATMRPPPSHTRVRTRPRPRGRAGHRPHRCRSWRRRPGPARAT
jgi:hypothetical protein